MSRLIVKNLPKKISESQVKEKFSKHGSITDVQLKYKSDGSFRQFAFVGYENEEDAQTALKYLNKSYIGASKVSVEICKPLSDKDLPAKPVLISSNTEKNSSKVTKVDTKNDRQLEEFLALHNRSKSAVWMDDGLSNLKVEVNEDVKAGSAEESDDTGDEVNKPDSTAFKAISDREYLKSKIDKKSEVGEKEKKFSNLLTVKLTNLPCKVTKKDIKNFFKPVKCKSIRIPVKAGFAYVGLASEKDVNNAMNKHNSFLDGHQIKIKCVKKSDSEKPTKKFVQNPNTESLMDSGRIFIRNLSYKVNEEVLEKLFHGFGQLTEVNLPIDKLTRQCKGFGFVTFMFPEDAVKAFTELDGSILQGRTLHLLPAEVRETGDPSEEDEGKFSFKQKRLKELKGKSSAGYNWNSLFLGGNAVADVLSKNYNVSKEEIYDPHADGSAAVRIAIGETQIVNDIKNFLSDNGVSLDAFKNNKVRSKRVILVKNLPAGTKSSDITEKFGVFGPLQRVILHPSGLTGLVEFAEPSEARNAFSSLAYSRFKYLPLYLEWAPENVFIESFASHEQSSKASKNNLKDIIAGKEKQKDDDSDDENIGNDGSNKLFVKNLNFITTDEDLIKHFSQVGEVKIANVAKKKDWSSGTLVSMGYGFVTFTNSSDCEQAIKNLQHSLLDERMIEIKRSHSVALQPDRVDRHKRNLKSSTKILVKNVAFQANKRELEELFRPFGEVKSIRLPKKLEGSHRGFCFVEYGSKKHAKKAMSILGESTHLYGRRLVLEWAESEEDLNAIRKRTADNYSSGPGPVKKAKGVADIVDQNAPDSE